MITNLSDTTPAAPANGVNCKWQQDGSGNGSVAVVGDGDSTHFLRGDGVFALPSGGGGGGGVPSGSPVYAMGGISTPPRAIGPLGTGYSMILKIPGRCIQNIGATGFKVRIQRGSGSHFSACVCLTTAIDDLTVITSTAVTFGSSATPTLSGGLNLSDNIAVTMDASHDYWIIAYNDSGDSSFWGLEPAVADNYAGGPGVVGGYISGDQTAVSPIAASSLSTGFGMPWDAVLTT